ncbi:MAG: PHP domain-containing protein [Gemmatimonadetes bacterium]|nr:PHP domain-containing protein [Gemmatimonadota bacterium]
MSTLVIRGRSGVLCAAAACAVILAGAAFPASAVVDAVSGAAPSGARLSLPASYVALAPLSDLLDTLSLFTVPQHAAFVVTVALAYVVIRVVAARARRTTVARELVRAGAMMIGLVALYAVLALVPRPMAALSLSRADELAFDVHAHTDASHDGRRGFTPEHVRAWHREAGFAAVYVTDHRSFDGAAAGVRANPERAGLGTSLFSGIEIVSARRHVNVLGAAMVDSAHFRRGTLEPDSLSAFRPADGSPVVLVLTIPGSLDGLSPSVPLNAVELSDAAPRGLRSGELQRDAILRLARERRLALVAASDNHGWGRTAAAWTVVSIPGWREMAPSALDIAIRQVLLHAPGNVRVVERRRLPTGGVAARIATVPRAAWLMARTLSWPERASWIAWIAAITALYVAAGRRWPD